MSANDVNQALPNLCKKKVKAVVKKLKELGVTDQISSQYLVVSDLTNGGLLKIVEARRLISYLNKGNDYCGSIEQPNTSKSTQQANQLEGRLAHELLVSQTSKSAGETGQLMLQISQPSTRTSISTKHVRFEDETALAPKRLKISEKSLSDHGLHLQCGVENTQTVGTNAHNSGVLSHTIKDSHVIGTQIIEKATIIQEKLKSAESVQGNIDLKCKEQLAQKEKLDQVWEKLKHHLEQKAMEFYGEKDCFRRDKIKIANLQISSDLPSAKEAQILEQDHNRKNMARFYNKKNVDCIAYQELFNKVKTRIEQISYKGDTTEAEEKFLRRHGNLVVISGQPGIGKTTLTKCMLYKMWKFQLFNPAIVFFIRFRKVDYKEKTDLLQFLAPDFQGINGVEDRKSILKRLQETDNVFILMDGLDEADIDPKMRCFKSCNIHSDNLYPAERFIQNLLAGEILPYCKKLITSRPHRITQLQNTDFKPLVLFTIQGIDEAARKQICFNICGQDNERCKRILSYLRANPDLESHCHTPVICIMVIEGLDNKYDVAEKSNADMSSVDFVMEKSDSTLTAIFVYALENWLLKKLDAKGNTKFPIKNICKFALEKYIKGQLYFPCYELDEQGVDNQYWSTFLNSFLEGNQELYFIHLMWQEFLAAVKLRLYTNKEDFGSESCSESILSKLSSKKFEAVTTRFLFGLCNKRTLAALLRNITLEEGRNDPVERTEIEKLLTNFALKKLTSLRDVKYLSDNAYEPCDDNSDEEEVALNDKDDNDDVSVGSEDDVSNEKEFNDVADYHDDNIDDLDERSYFASVLPTLGWVHEMGNNSFIIQAATCLRKKFCIEHQILPSDIPIIMHVLRARNAKMVLEVVYPRFLGNCFKYFFQELHKMLKEKKNIQMTKLSLEKIYIRGGDLLRFVMSQHCVGKVQQLDLVNCKITNQTVKLLAAEIKKRERKKPIKVLNLCDNQDIDDVGAAILKNCYKMGKILEMNLEGCNVSTVSVMDSEPQDLMIENDRLRLKITDLEREVEEVRKVVISRMSERQ